jgi:hypothetical protein
MLLLVELQSYDHRRNNVRVTDDGNCKRGESRQLVLFFWWKWSVASCMLMSTDNDMQACNSKIGGVHAWQPGEKARDDLRL